MIWQMVEREDVLAATALHHSDKKLILKTPMARLGKLLDRYYGGYATYMLKSADRVFNDPRDRQDYRGGVVVQVFMTEWLEAINAIPTLTRYGFNDRHHLVAVHYYCTDPDNRLYSSVEDIAKIIKHSKSTVHRMIDGHSYCSQLWPNGRPGISDWLVAVAGYIVGNDELGIMNDE